MPPTDDKSTPAAKPVLELTDAFTGNKTPAYLGGDPLPEIPEGDRGDNLGNEVSESPGTLVSGSAAAALAAAAAEAKTDEEKAAEAEAAGEEKPPEVAPPELTDEEKAALPKRDKDGKFQKAEDEGTKDDEPRIPKARLDKEIERRKAAELRLAEKEAEKAAALKGEEHTFDFDKAEEEYMDLLLDGKIKEAAAKRKEIRAAERAENEAMADERAGQVTTRTAIRNSLQTIGDEYEASYAEFNPENPAFDEMAMVQVKAIYGGFLEQGLYSTPDGAFKAALDTVVKAGGFKRLGDVEPDPTPTPAPARTAAARVAAVAAQPPSTAKAGESSAARGAHEIDVTQLTEDQLAKLPAATLRRLRGDDL